MSVNVNKKHISVLCISVLIAILLCVFRTYLLLNCIEPGTGFYIIGTKLGVYFGAALVLAIASCLAGCIFSKVKVPENLSSESTGVVFSSSLCGFLCATVLVGGGYSLLQSAEKNIFLAIEVLLCIPCMIFFFSLCVKANREKNAGNLILSLFPAVFYAIRTIHVFTDTTTQINTSQRSLSLITLCSMMLLFVFEAYFLLPSRQSETEAKEKRSGSLRYAVMTLIAMLLAVSCELPYIIVNAFWMYDAELIAINVLDLCVGVYAFSRAATLCRQ